MSQEATGPGSAEVTTTPAAPRKRRRPLRFVLLVLVPLLAIAGAFYAYAMSGRYITTENAYVKATKIAVSSDIDGRVVAVHIAENRRVEAGDLMIELDPRPWQIALTENDAELARTRSQIEQLKVDYSAALAELAETKARISHLESQVARYASLSKRGVATSAKYEEVEADLLAARRRVATQAERVRQALVAIGGDPDRAVEEHPLYRAVMAARERVLLQLDHTRIVAPQAGVVTALNLEPGEYVEEGKALFAIVDDSAPWIEANLKETQLTWILQGQAVEVTVDAYPGVTWTASIDGIAPATGAEFAILPPQNASGNWVKVVQRVPVRLKLHPNPDRPPLRAGMTAWVSIDTGRETELLTAARAAISGVQEPPRAD
ncbi:MAG: HlyD family secretion protein [Pseudomonadota bacterium]|nr:HlyD family secretion protein [Pseudomonadota bacterium]